MLTAGWEDEIELVKEGKETVKEGFEDKDVTVENLDVDPVVVKIEDIVEVCKEEDVTTGKVLSLVFNFTEVEAEVLKYWKMFLDIPDFDSNFIFLSEGTLKFESL